MWVFFAALYLPQDGKLFCSDGGDDPLQALLEGALASSDFTFRKR
jgi:hypothetical protein